MLFADAPVNVIQVEWQSLAALGSILGTAIVGAAKILASQWGSISAAASQRHNENRADAQEARAENRTLSQLILNNQAKATEAQVRTAEILTSLQREIERVNARLDGSKMHVAFHDSTKD